MIKCTHLDCGLWKSDYCTAGTCMNHKYNVKPAPAVNTEKKLDIYNVNAGELEKVIGERGSGKTSILLHIAQQNGCTVVEPNCRMVEYAKQLAKSLNYNDVNIIPFREMIRLLAFSHYGVKFVIDELDLCLIQFDILSYSNDHD